MESLSKDSLALSTKVTLPPCSELLYAASTNETSFTQTTGTQTETSSIPGRFLCPKRERTRETSPNREKMLWLPQLPQWRLAFTAEEHRDKSDSASRSPGFGENNGEEINLSNFEPLAWGWFTPTSRYVQKMLTKSRNMRLGELVDSFYLQDSSRALYGKDGQRRQGRPPVAGNPGLEGDNNMVRHIEPARERHYGNEKKRRDRHFDWQKDTHQRVCELCCKAADEELKEASQRSSKTSRAQPRAPAKDDQFLGALFMISYGGILIQRLWVEIQRRDTRIETLKRQIDTLTKQKADLIGDWPSSDLYQSKTVERSMTFGALRVDIDVNMAYTLPSPSSIFDDAEG